jgi:hypothetical protein
MQSIIGTRNAISLGNGTCMIQGRHKLHEIFASIAGVNGVIAVCLIILAGITWIKKFKIKRQE